MKIFHINLVESELLQYEGNKVKHNSSCTAPQVHSLCSISLRLRGVTLKVLTETSPLLGFSPGSSIVLVEWHPLIDGITQKITNVNQQQTPDPFSSL